MTISQRATVPNYIITPLKGRVLIRKDEDRTETKGGIILPDDAKTPVITGRVVEVSPDLENDHEFPVAKYDKVLVDPRNAIPVDLESDNKLFIIAEKDVVAVFSKTDDRPNS